MNCYFREAYPVYVYRCGETSPKNGLVVGLNGGGLNWYSQNILISHLPTVSCFLKIEDCTKIKEWEF